MTSEIRPISFVSLVDATALRHTVVGMHETATLTSFSDFKTRYFRNIFDAPWYIRNANLHRDFQTEMVTNETGKFAKKHEERLLHHVKVKAIQVLNNSELVQRLNRKKNLLSWCSDH
jgi:hypothetical protein